MTYWIVCKIEKGKFIYVSGTDENGRTKHTENENEAQKFSIMSDAMHYFNLGYIISKKYK